MEGILKKTARVVIVGGGFGGIRVAKALAGTSAEVTLIDRNNHHLFQPLLYQVATAGLSPTDIAYPIRTIVRGLSNVEVMMSEVTGVDSARKLLRTTNGEVPFDFLVLATGARHSYFGHDDWERHAPGLKSVEDATTVRKNILLAFEKAELQTDLEIQKEYLTFVLVGGGPTGVELAGSIAELAHQALARDFRHIDPDRTRILLVEAGKRVLAGFPELLSQKATDSLKRLGVEVQTGSRVQKVDGEGVIVDGTRIKSKTVIWAAGVVASPAGKWLSADTDHAGRVKVLPDLSVPHQPHVFVIGDTALALDFQGHPLPGIAPVAMQQGKYVARTIRARIEGLTLPKPFHYRDKGSLATVGRSSAIAAIGKLRLWGFIAWITWLFVHIFFLIGFRNRIIVLLNWGWAYVTFQRGARLITWNREDGPAI